jgi:hypothetical protein
VLVALLAGAVVVAASGRDAPSVVAATASSEPSSRSPARTPAAPAVDGTQRYATIGELHAAVTAGGTRCDDLTENPDPPLSVALARCDLRGADEQIYLHLWRDGQHRDDGTKQNMTRLSSEGTDYCFVVGKGEGAWSVNASADPSFCRALSSRLGGRLLEQETPVPTTSTAPPTTTQPAPTTATTTPPPPPSPPVSAGQENALRTAADYLDFLSFSRTGLIEQLEYEGYSTADATWAVDQLGADWNVQAARKAREYLDFTAFSRQGLIDQLLYEGFTPSEAEYGVAQEYD